MLQDDYSHTMTTCGLFSPHTISRVWLQWTPASTGLTREKIKDDVKSENRQSMVRSSAPGINESWRRRMVQIHRDSSSTIKMNVFIAFALQTHRRCEVTASAPRQRRRQFSCFSLLSLCSLLFFSLTRCPGVWFHPTLPNNDLQNRK